MRFGQRQLAAGMLLLFGAVCCGDPALKAEGEACVASAECAVDLTCDFNVTPHVCRPMQTRLPDAAPAPDGAGVDGAAPADARVTIDALPRTDATVGVPDAAPQPDARPAPLDAAVIVDAPPVPVDGSPGPAADAAPVTADAM